PVAPSRSRAARRTLAPEATRRRVLPQTKRPTAAPQRRPKPPRRARPLRPGSLRMTPAPGTAPDARAANDASHAEAACAACGVVLDARLHAGEIVDVFRGHLRGEPAAAVAVKLTRARWRGHPGAIELIAREHRALQSIEHAHVVGARGFAERSGVA